MEVGHALSLNAGVDGESVITDTQDSGSNRYAERFQGVRHAATPFPMVGCHDEVASVDHTATMANQSEFI